jgi:predicted DNA-binding transcriptional regulator YafY
MCPVLPPARRLDSTSVRGLWWAASHLPPGRAVPRNDQVIRQWKILRFLESRGVVTLSRLADDLDEPCHPRTLRRDLDALSLIGVPVYTEKRNGTTIWRLPDDYRRVPLPVTPTELLALDMVRRLAQPLDGTFVSGSLHSVLAKIRSALAPKTREAFAELVASVSIGHRATKHFAPHAKTLDALREAIENNRVIRMTYDSHNSGRVSSRKADPYHVRFYDNSLYLVAHCHRRKDVRLFAIDRIKALDVTGERFNPPLFFSPDDYFKHTFGVYQGKKPETVTLRFNRKTARWVAEKRWHASQRMKKLKNGVLRMELTVAITPEFISWVRSFGSEVTIEAPARLIKMITDDAWTVVGRYERKGVKRGQAVRKVRTV